MKSENIVKMEQLLRLLIPINIIDFKCTGCGNCCKHRGDIFLMPSDIYYICKHLNLSLRSFMKEYTHECDTKIFIKAKDDDEKTCIFYNRQIGCMIHPIKPITCYMFPFVEMQPGHFQVQPIECVFHHDGKSPKPVNDIISENSFRYEAEKEINLNFFKVFDYFDTKYFVYSEKGMDTSKLKNFFFTTFYYNIDLGLNEAVFFKWFNEQINLAKKLLTIL